jgi:hypothetical protein
MTKFDFVIMFLGISGMIAVVGLGIINAIEKSTERITKALGGRQ